MPSAPADMPPLAPMPLSSATASQPLDGTVSAAPARPTAAPDGEPAIQVNGSEVHTDQPPAVGPVLNSYHTFGPVPGCTAPQLRRFIKSRPYVPMHELRRRFGINGGDDDVTQIDLRDGRIYVGLPSREGSLLGELLRGGDIGYELSLDPRSPIVIGLYPMRPVARS